MQLISYEACSDSDVPVNISDERQHSLSYWNTKILTSFQTKEKKWHSVWYSIQGPVGGAINKNQDSVFNITSRRTLNLWFYSQQGQETSLYKVSRPAQRSKELPIQWLPGLFPLGYRNQIVKLMTQLHLLPKVKNEWSSNPLWHMP